MSGYQIIQAIYTVSVCIEVDSIVLGQLQRQSKSDTAVH